MTPGARPQRPAPGRTLAEAAAFSTRHRRRVGDAGPLPHGPGGAVLVIPCSLRGDAYSSWFRAGLAALGYAPHGWGLGTNLGPTRAKLDGLRLRVEDLAAAHGPLDVVGFSLGGLFARWIAAERPALVRQVVTVCSPIRDPAGSLFFPLQPILPLWRGPDLATLAATVAAPSPVPATAIYSRSDGIVAWESCRVPGEPAVGVDCLHVLAAVDPAVFGTVARVLAGDPGQVS